jgi:hypothetical protein
MMSEEQLAQHDADEFWNYKEGGDLIDYGFSGLEYEIDSKIRRETVNYKLQFLYRLQSICSSELEEHLKRCSYKATPQRCPENVYYFKVGRLLNQKIQEIHPNYDRQSLNIELVNKTLLSFNDFPEASKPFNVALQTFKEGGDDRQVVDGMRLAFEIFLKKKLKNEKSIENQRSDLGNLLKNTGTSPEIMNMFDKLINGYTSYQNEYVKHNDKIKRDEVELLINLTLTFISFILNK